MIKLDKEQVERLQSALAMMPAKTQAAGKAYYWNGHVRSVEQIDADEFGALVQGDFTYEVYLQFDRDELFWYLDCSCPVSRDCKHTHAAGLALLQEAAAKPEKATTALEKLATPDDKFRRFLNTNARSPEDQGFARQILWSHNASVRGLPPDSWSYSMGFQWPKSLRIEKTQSLVEFWNLLAAALLARGKRIPAFLQSETDLVKADEIAAKIRREEEIKEWRSKFESSQVSVFREPQAHELIRLRICVSEHIRRLEFSYGEGQPFKAVHHSFWRQMEESEQGRAASMSPESRVLWHLYSKTLSYFHDLSKDEMARVLAKVFELPQLDPLVVNEQEKPFYRSAERLKWVATPNDDPEQDYLLRLTLPDGAAVPPILLNIPCQSGPRILTTTTLYHAPLKDAPLLRGHRELKIPGAALMSPKAAALLHTLDLPLPKPVSAKLKVVPVTMRIRCDIKPTGFSGNRENCIIHLEAITPDNRTIAKARGSNWERAQPGRQDPWVTYNYDAVPGVEALLAPLVPKNEYDFWSVRVTKDFPEKFVQWARNLPPTVELQLAGELQTLMNAAVAGELTLDVTEESIDWFDLRVNLKVSDTTLTKEEIKLLLNAKGRYVRLPGKGWRKLEYNLTADEDATLARLGLTARELSAEPQRLHALQLADPAAKKFLKEEQYEAVQRRASEIKARVTPDVPKNISATLRPYQLAGFHFLAYLAENRFGGILADDMGLGKTVQTLTWLAWLRERATDGPRPSLVVCPKSVTDNWRAEAERFVTGMSVKVWSASELQGFNQNAADLHVLNYNQLRALGESLTRIQFRALILDEGQYIKNPSSISAQIARTLKADHRLVLSGTPIENRLMDLWSLMTFAMPGALGSRTEFGRLYDSKADPLARGRLAARVRPFLLRRTKSQVAKDLPEKIEEDLYCEMEGDQKKLYQAELKQARQMLLKIQSKQDLNRERFNFLTSLLRLRQICCDPRLVNPTIKEPGAKLQAALEQLEPLMEEGHKVLIFSQFVEMLQMLKKELTDKGYTQFYLAGETEDRGALVKRFQESEGAAVFLISLKAGGFGLNLTAANYVILFDPWWNPAVENQAIDRTHRIGQSRTVIAYRMLIKDSIEEKIRALQKKKSTLAQDVLGEERFSQSLTIDDLHYLLSS